MTEVRKHQRKTASGKTTTVRHHTRQGGDGQGSDAERARAAWQDRAAPHYSTLPVPEPRAADDSFWDEDSQEPEGEWWADDEPAPARRGDRAFPKMQEQMREWRARPEPETGPVVPDTSPLGRALGTDTQEGAEKFARMKAYREAGYDGPLDSDNRIPDPDDPANHESLHALAALGE